jgi:breast cancer 2 susceptibility protein
VRQALYGREGVVVDWLISAHSSSRKRQRLSSPAYDQDILELSQEDLAQLDQIEAQFNQASKSASREARERRTREIEKALRAASPVCSANSKPLQGPDDDAENPFGSNSKQNGFAASSGVSGFASASAFRPASKVPDVSQARSRSPSPENLPEPDYSSWFDPDATANTTLPLFQTAKATMSPIPAQNTGFVKLSDRSFIAPSESALKKAQEKMKAWQEDDPLPPQVAHSPLASQPADSLASNHAPSSPSPAVFNRASALHAPGVLGDLDSNREDSLAKVKAFKSPLLAKQLKPLLTSGTGYTSSPLNPHRPAPTAFASASHHPLASTPARPSVGIHRGIASGSARATSGKPKFATPFKPGMRPGDPGRAALEKGKEKERIRQPPLPPTPCGNARPKESSGNLAIADRTEHGAELKQRTCPQTSWCISRPFCPSSDLSPLQPDAI